ncbi:MAG: hypothetical protein R3D55_24455 [Chloroflexota bacterium]
MATLYNNFLLKRDNLSPRDKEYAVRVQESLRNLAGFLDEILTTAKMDQGKLSLSLSASNLNRLISEVAQNHAEMARMHGFHLELDLPPCPSSLQ